VNTGTASIRIWRNEGTERLRLENFCTGARMFALYIIPKLETKLLIAVKDRTLD
jgi:hypothetical protein